MDYSGETPMARRSECARQQPDVSIVPAWLLFRACPEKAGNSA
jgi:hypothetical protein